MSLRRGAETAARFRGYGPKLLVVLNQQQKKKIPQAALAQPHVRSYSDGPSSQESRRPGKSLAIGVGLGFAAAFTGYYATSGDLKSPTNDADITSSEPSPSPLASAKLTPQRVQTIDLHLRQNEKSYVVNHDLVSTFDINFLGSNSPIEDMNAKVRWRDKMMFGVFDGHGGYECSSLVSRHLPSYVASELLSTKPSSPILVQEALISAFKKLDSDIMSVALEAISGTNVSDEQFENAVHVAMSGSCAVMGMLDKDDLYVANTGDSRALLGRFDSKANKYIPVPLSHDQTAKETSEYNRIVKEHPGEESTVIVRNRILGSLMPSRAFGDARYKLTAEAQEKIRAKFRDDDKENTKSKRKVVPKNFRTPPYVTSEPVVNHRKLDEHDHFMVLATDGLWDFMSNDEVVNLVSEYLQHQDPATPTSTFSPTDQHIYNDTNCSTHLIRNALGPDYEKVSMMLNYPKNVVRQYRDDMTVIVVFFKNVKNKYQTFQATVDMDAFKEVDLADSKVELDKLVRPRAVIS